MDHETATSILVLAGAIATALGARRRRRRRQQRVDHVRATDALASLLRATGAARSIVWVLSGSRASIAVELANGGLEPVASAYQKRPISDLGRSIIARARAGEMMRLRLADTTGPLADTLRELGATEAHFALVRRNVLLMVTLGTLRGCEASAMAEHMRMAASRLRGAV